MVRKRANSPVHSDSVKVSGVVGDQVVRHCSILPVRRRWSLKGIQQLLLGAGGKHGSGKQKCGSHKGHYANRGQEMTRIHTDGSYSIGENSNTEQGAGGRLG